VVLQPRSTFLARNAHRLAVDEPTFAQARRLTAKISETPYRGRPLGRFIEESMCEATIYFTEGGAHTRVHRELLSDQVRLQE